MNCALSGEIPEEPVVSLKSGHIFERRLIEKYIEQTGTCPITKEELSKKDLLAVQSAKVTRPRPANAASVPALLKTLQSEWDALMLETYTLKQHLNTTREELARVMYQHDAACRVIARLIKERDAARAALTDVQKNATVAAASATTQSKSNHTQSMDVADDAGLNSTILAKLDDTSQRLSKSRTNRVKELGAAVASREKIAAYKEISSHPLHSSSQPGVTCVDIHAASDNMVATGGADGAVVVFNRATGKIEDTLKSHKKKITSVKFSPVGDAPSVVFSASQDATACVWKRTEGKFNVAQTLQDHKGAVVGVTVHPSGDYFVTASADASWNFYDTHTGQLYTSVLDEKNTAYTCVEFHPDGLILGTGTEGDVVKIFDAKHQKNVCTFDGHSQGVTAISFSENGYYLATGDGAGTVKLWDLRKQAVLRAFTLEDNSAISSLRFDLSGSYLAVGGNELAIFRTKPWESVKTFSHGGAVTGVSFGQHASFVASTSKDRNLRFFA